MNTFRIIAFIAVAFVLTYCKNGTDNKENPVVAKDSLSLLIDELTEKIKDNPNKAELYYQRAGLLFQKKSLDSADADIHKAITLDSTHADYFVRFGEISFIRGKAGVALTAYEKAAQLDPKNQEALLKLAEIALYLREYKKVFERCNQALEINPDNAKAFFIKGIAKKESGDTAAAIQDFRTTVDKDPEYYHAYMQLGLLFSIKKKPIAVDYLNNALRLNPKSIEAYYALGMFFQETGEYNKAFEAYNSILQIDPNYKYAHYNMGYIHYQYLKNPSEAARRFSSAINADPSYAEAWYMRGLCREALGDLMNAHSDYKKALQLRDGYEKAILGLNRVEDLMKK